MENEKIKREKCTIEPVVNRDGVDDCGWNGGAVKKVGKIIIANIYSCYELCI